MVFQLKLTVFTLLVGMLICTPQAYTQETPAELAPQKISFNCDEVPLVFCPADFKACPGASTLPSNTGYAVAEPGDIFCDQPLLMFEDSILSTGACPGAVIIQRTWTATDPKRADLTSSCVQIIDLTDTDAPIFLNCPNDTTIAPNSGCMASFTWEPPYVMDFCGRLTLDVTHTNGNKFPLGETDVVFTARDACGNVAQCSFTITVEGECCDLPPIIVCPGDYSGCPGDSIHPKRIGKPRVMPGRPSCATPEVTWRDDTISMGACAGAFTIERTWTARDPHDKSLMVTCIQTITLEDDQVPFLLGCPGTITVDSDEDCKAIVDWIPPRAVDNCDSVLVTSTHMPGDTFEVGTTVVTYVATDACGNTKNCTFEVVVIQKCCNENPIIVCPPDFYDCPGASTDPGVTGYATAMPGGPYCDTPLVRFEETIIDEGPCPNAKVIKRLWIAEDPKDPDLRSTCLQYITLKDTTPPTFTRCPQDTTLSPNTGCEAVVSWDFPLVIDNCGLAGVMRSHEPGDTFPIGNTTVVFTATDNCGNTSTCSFIITVLDDCCNKPPIVICPPDYVGCLKTSTDTSLTGVAIAQKSHPTCDEPLLSFSDDTVQTGPCPGQFLIERTWVAQDPNTPALRAECIQTLSLEDKDNPFFWECPNDTLVLPNLGCKAVVTWIPPVAMDDCGLTSVTSTHVPGDTFDQGNTTIIYTAVDACGNDSTCSFVITVDGNCCDMPPVILCPMDHTGCINSSTDPSVTGQATAMKAKPICDEPVLTYIDDTLSAGPCNGQYHIERIWTATDPNDNTLKASCIQNLILKDETSPLLTNCPTDTAVSPNVDCEAVVTWSMPNATDNCGPITLTSTHSSGDTFQLGITVVTITATDACGNVSTCSFEVIVKDECCTTPPIIDCPADFVACPGTSTDPTISGIATASKGGTYCEAPIVSYSDDTLSTGPCPGQYLIARTWTATDPKDASLTSDCTQQIKLEDLVAPMPQNCPNDITISPNLGCEAIVDWTEPSATDNCSSVTISSNYEPNDTFAIGVTIVIYTFTDACGNASTCGFNIIVLDDCCNKPPIVDCPSNFVGCIFSSLDPMVTGQPTITKGHPSCDEPVLTFNDDTISAGPCNGQFVVERTWTATDPNDGNLSASCTQSLELRDDEAPMLFDCPSDTTVMSNLSCEAIVSWLEPTAVDDCGMVTITSTHSPGDTFEVGITVVTYTATDGCGNFITCSFDVIVDGDIFILDCPNDTIIQNPAFPDGDYVYWTPPVVTECEPNCPDSIPGFIFMGERNGHRYFCSLYSATWEDARRDCAGVGGYLAVMNTASENSYVASKLMGRTAYIGLSDRNVEGQFEWVNGDPLSYTNWAPGQPDDANGIQDHVELAPSGFWNDQYAHVRNEFVCEIPCYDVRQIGGPGNGEFFNCGTTTVTYVANDAGGNSDTCSFEVTVDCSGYKPLCAVAGLNSQENWIESVTLANLYNQSGDNDGYGDYHNLCAEVENASSEELCMEIGYGGATRNVFWKVWIDYNEDQDFEDIGEEVFEGYGNTTLCGHISFPDNMDIRTTMRIGISHGAWPNPCGVILSGEYEDYCIKIESGQALSFDAEKEGIRSEGIIETLETKVVEIFPNPANSRVAIRAKGQLPVQFRIVDTYGQTILINDWRGIKNIEHIDLKDWPPGQYFTILGYQDGSTKTKSFIVTED